MKLCVIGAGAAGLCAVKHAIAFGCEVTAFEQTDQIGGTWVYTDEVGKDKNGLDVHSSMYQGLNTNLPKEIMGYPDFPFAEQEMSYIPQDEVLKFYQSYANHFSLHQYIKFEHHVLRVRPLLDDKWEVIVQDMKTRNFETYIFDVVLVCTGHFSSPKMPAFQGQKIFEGKQVHSHDYRCAAAFRDETVLVIGAGPSGLDCVIEVSEVAKNVHWSHHVTRPIGVKFRDNVTQRPDVREIKSDGVVFVDGSYQDCDVIVYCTGYQYTFPFLSVDCGIACDNNYVRPLHKHCLNINRPSMGFIGLANYICPNQILDLQVRFCLTFMMGIKELPTKDEMLHTREQEIEERKQQGTGLDKPHYLGVEYQQLYFDDLATIASLKPIKPVITKIFNKGLCNLLYSTATFRDEAFKIVDDENFVVFKLK